MKTHIPSPQFGHPGFASGSPYLSNELRDSQTLGLAPGADIVYTTKLHWIIFVRPMLFLGTAIFIMQPFEPVSDISRTAGLILLSFSFLLFLIAIMNYRTWRFILTQQWLKVRLGWIRKERLELSLAKTVSIRSFQGLFGRLLGFGSITITGAGGTTNSFPRIRRPIEFERKIREQVAIAQRVEHEIEVVH